MPLAVSAVLSRSSFGQNEIRRLDQYFALHLAQPLTQRLMDDPYLGFGVDPGRVLDQNAARCPDKIIPNLDQPAASSSELS